MYFLRLFLCEIFPILTFQLMSNFSFFPTREHRKSILPCNGRGAIIKNIHLWIFFLNMWKFIKFRVFQFAIKVFICLCLCRRTLSLFQDGTWVSKKFESKKTNLNLFKNVEIISIQLFYDFNGNWIQIHFYQYEWIHPGSGFKFIKIHRIRMKFKIQIPCH